MTPKSLLQRNRILVLALCGPAWLFVVIGLGPLLYMEGLSAWRAFLVPAMLGSMVIAPVLVAMTIEKRLQQAADRYGVRERSLDIAVGVLTLLWAMGSFDLARRCGLDVLKCKPADLALSLSTWRVALLLSIGLAPIAWDLCSRWIGKSQMVVHDQHTA